MRWLAPLIRWFEGRRSSRDDARPTESVPPSVPDDPLERVERAARGIVPPRKAMAAAPVARVAKPVEEARVSAVWSPAPAEQAHAPVVRRARRRTERALQLALQGGGSHGAFTWGVLDRLLEDERLVFPAISGASAGAMNGAMLVCGYAAGGREGAQKALTTYWNRLGDMADVMAPLQAGASWRGADFGLPDAHALQSMFRMWSPAQLNPLNINPLRGLLDELVDVDALQSERPMRLHVSTTDVETGEPRIFTGRELSIDVLMASACLPFLFQAVTVDGVAYWDGGYSSNPPLAPLLERGKGRTGRGPTTELLLVQLSPERRPGIPTTATEIMHRVNEITFNASLVAEWRAIEALHPQGSAEGAVRLHRIALHEALADVDAASAGTMERAFLHRLRDAGRAAAQRWLDAEDGAAVEASVQDAASAAAPDP